MNQQIDGTHHPELRSWVPSANEPGSDFPIQNLPFGIFARRGGGVSRVGVAIGDQVLDLGSCADRSVLEGIGGPLIKACRAETLGPLFRQGAAAWGSLRQRLSEVLGKAVPASQRPTSCLVPQDEVKMSLPADIGDYTDFYASIDHARNVGSMFRPDQPLMPNYTWMPIGYHGRASSIVPTGAPVHRPDGQRRPDPAAPPVFGPSQSLDYEVELGAMIGTRNSRGRPVSLAQADGNIFGLCLVNDWSARDIQAWEYQPLGPFLGKSFATTISPWLVTLDALAPFRTARAPREEGAPEPLAYLEDPTDRARGGVDVTLEATIRSPRMVADGIPPWVVSRSSARDLYWTLGQMVAHHTSNGCNLRPGDLLASGTVSGPAPENRGCLLERTWRGAEPLELPTGEQRRFLEDGDEIVIRGWCEREGFARIGFGECRGTIAPAGEGL